MKKAYYKLKPHLDEAMYRYDSFLFLSLFWMNLLLLSLLSGCSATDTATIAKKETPALQIALPELLAVTTKDNETSTKRDSSIVFTFSDSMDSGSLTINNEDNQCNSTIQISSDEFKSCVRMSSIQYEETNKKITLIPKGTYAANTQYQIKLTQEVKSEKGGLLKQTASTLPGFLTIWAQQIGSSGDDIGYDIKIASDGSIYIVGHTSANEDNDESDLFLAKYSPDGFQKWIQQVGLNQPVSSAVLILEDSGNLRLSGFSENEEVSQVILATYDSEGKQLFSKVHQQSGTSHGNGLALDEQGNIYYAGSSRLHIKSISHQGNRKWGAQLDQGIKLNAIAADSSNGLYVTGSFSKTLGGKKSVGGEDVFLLKLYQSGSQRWSKTIGSPLNEAGTVLSTFSDEFVAVSGYVPQVTSVTDALTLMNDVFVAKYDNQGKQIWNTLIKGNANEKSTALLWISESELLVAGYTESDLENNTSAGGEDAFLAKLDKDGKLMWLKQFGTGQNDRALGIAMDKEQQIFITGSTEGRMGGSTHSGAKDIFLVQFEQNGTMR